MRSLSSFLQSLLPTVSHKIENLSQIENILDKLLPEEKRQACAVVDYQQGTLTLGVRDSIWLTVFKFELPAWRDQLRKQGLPGLVSIQLKLLVDWHKEIKGAPKKNTPPSRMAIESIQALREWAKITVSTDVEEN